MFSSARHDWQTPRRIFEELDAEFHFELDVCASPTNALCGRYFTEVDEAFWQTWAPSRCWMNPPYGKQIGLFVQRAAHEAMCGALVVALLPSRTDTTWWHEYVLPHADEVRYIKGRLRYDDDPDRLRRAPFPSAVVIWRPTHAGGLNRS